MIGMESLYAVVSIDDKAKNFIMWDGVTTPALPEGCRLVLIPPNTTYGYDWIWNGSVFVEPEPPPPGPPVVPASITPRQCRLLLLNKGLLASVTAVIAQQNEDVRITWEYALEFRRDDPLINQLAPVLNFTQEMLDQFFIEAATL